jgi:hypothetical protein
MRHAQADAEESEVFSSEDDEEERARCFMESQSDRDSVSCNSGRSHTVSTHKTRVVSDMKTSTSQARVCLWSYLDPQGCMQGVYSCCL